MPELVRGLKRIFVDSKDEELAVDCAKIFNSKAINANSENYSTGSTYFIKANEKPRTGLEKLALDIFKRHTQGMNYDPAESGAEWWSQVIHPEDDIGIHWDRDYGLEEAYGQHIYPYVGTVTYLSDIGAPTAVFNKEGTEMAHEEFVGNIEQMVVSCPSIGNHIVFDGTMLHAAPADIYVNQDDNEDDEDDEDDEDEDSVDATNLTELLENLPTRRISFLVNIWVNHVPSQSKKCPEKLIKKLSTVLSDADLNMSSDYILPEIVTLSESQITRSIDLQFNNTNTNYDVHIPLPSLDVVNKFKDEEKLFMLSYPASKQINLKYSEEQPSDDEDDEDDEEEEEESEEEVVEVTSKKSSSKRKGELSSSEAAKKSKN